MAGNFCFKFHGLIKIKVSNISICVYNLQAMNYTNFDFHKNFVINSNC